LERPFCARPEPEKKSMPPKKGLREMKKGGRGGKKRIPFERRQLCRKTNTLRKGAKLSAE